MTPRRFTLTGIALAIVAVVLALFPGTTSAATLSLTAPGWYGYHAGNTNAGVSSTMPAAGPLSLVAQRHLDGAVYGSPIVARGIIIAATENDTVYGLSTSGAVLWHTHLGTPSPASQRPCGNISPLGITGSPVYDPATGAVYVVVETATGGVHHALVALDAASGHLKWRRGVDYPGVTTGTMQQRGALTTYGGRVWVTFGGLAGDCGNYKGRLIGVPATGQCCALVYTVPTAREAGMWQPSGPVRDRAGHLLAAIGNGAAGPGDRYDHSDSVLEFNTRAQLLQYFAPTAWASENANDTDLGSIGPAVVGTRWLVQGGKSGRVYVLRQGSLGGIGGEVSSLTVAPSFGGTAVQGSVVYLPCTTGLRALSVDSSGHLHVKWTANSAVTGSPVVGGGRVWSLAPSAGRLYSLSPATGSAVSSIAVGTASRFATPALYQHLVIVPTLNGISIVRE